MAVLKDTIIIKDLAKTFYLKSETKEVLKDINITVKENEFLVLLGPGQCGKTVLLNILAGLDAPTGGEITFVNGRPPMGDLGVVFQRYALFPWKTVMGNVEINQKFKGKSKAERQAAAQKYIELVGLQGFENSLPKQLSGGMQQRVGIAGRTPANRTSCWLDEPFGALDAQTRYSMEDEILRIWEKDRRTVIFVTNNVEEAIYLGDRIILLGGHPTGVKKEYVPDLPRPRNYTDPAFLKLRNEIVANTDLVL